jgi:hypothetical protein
VSLTHNQLWICSSSVVNPEEIHLDLTTWTIFSFLSVASVITQYSVTSSVFEGARSAL